MARGRCRGGGANHWSDKLRYSHHLEFSEACVECRGNIGEFYFGGLGQQCSWTKYSVAPFLMYSSSLLTYMSLIG